MTTRSPVIIGSQVVLRGVEERDLQDARRLSDGLWRQLTLEANPHHWVIEAGGGFVGSARLHAVKTTDRRARYSIAIVSPPHLGRGLGSETTRLVLAYAFEVLRLHRVEARVLADNQRGLACLSACGFVQEGRQRESALVDGAWRDEVVLGVLEQEYRHLSASWPKLAPLHQGG